MFLAAGAAAALIAWLGATRRVLRSRWRALVVGLVGVAVGLAAVLVPLGDPVRPPAAPPGAGVWRLPDGSRLAYGVVRASRPGTPVVVLHGGPGVPDLAGHLTTLAPLAEDGHDVWAYAQRGTGDSSRLADPRRYTLDLAVADLEQVRLRVGAPRMILVGHSYGAVLAAAYLAAHPDRVERVVFSSPGDLAPDAPPGTPQSRLDLRQRLRLYGLLAPPRALLTWGLVQVDPAAAHAYAGDREVDARQDRVYAATLPGLHCPGHEGTALHGLGFYANQVPTSLRRPPVPEVRPALRGSRLPVLVIKGQCDYLSWASAAAYLDLFPAGVLCYLPGAGHEAYADRPDGYLAAVRAFLRDAPVPGRWVDPAVVPGDYQP